MVNNSLHSVESFSFSLGIFNNIVMFLKYKRDRWWVVQNFALLTIRAEGATFLNGCPYRLFIICHITSPFWVTENCHSSTSYLSAQSLSLFYSHRITLIEYFGFFQAHLQNSLCIYPIIFSFGLKCLQIFINVCTFVHIRFFKYNRL